MVVHDLVRESNGQPCLADAPCSSECQQPARSQKTTKLGNLLFAADKSGQLRRHVIELMAASVTLSNDDGRVAFKPLDSQSDQVGIADLQLASFPAGDGIARHAQCLAQLGLAQAKRLATSAEIYG